MSQILLTGASGFIGKNLLKHQRFKKAICIGTTNPLTGNDFIHFDLLKDDLDIIPFEKVECVIHLAGLAHEISKEKTNLNLGRYLEINTDATIKLAIEAIKKNVKKFIFVSTIKVLGEETIGNNQFNHKSPYNPKDPYAISKMLAEKKLLQLSKSSNMKLIIIRPPLVYGNNVKGNFFSLYQILKLRIPLPLGSIKNKRSILSINNFIDVLIKCIDIHLPTNSIFVVKDNEDISTPELILTIAKSMGIKNPLFNFPLFFLKIIFKLLRKNNDFYKLTNSLVVDQTNTCITLGWYPKYEINSELNKFNKLK